MGTIDFAPVVLFLSAVSLFGFYGALIADLKRRRQPPKK